MGCCRKGALALFVLSGVALAAFIAYFSLAPAPLNIPETGYWGSKKILKETDIPKDDAAIYNFGINFDDKMIADLRTELGTTKFFEPLEDSKFHYGFNLNYLKKVIDHWRTKYDFKGELARINAFPHYQTEIEGLKIHFFRSAATTKDPAVKVFPLLMLHGWPGSFVEFLKVASMLSQPKNGIAFDVIVPSLPGYGYSDAAQKQGMNGLVTARIFRKLMERLGYEKYYVQGGDWGAFVTTAMGALYPEKLRGIHVNMGVANIRNPLVMVKTMLVNMCSSTFGDGHNPPCLANSKDFVGLLRETGYMHIQATKPDTIGFTLLNSPAGLAAYILEKFSTWTDIENRDFEDGRLTKKFTLDEMLTNVMVYYASGSIISSQRFYRENFANNIGFQIFAQHIRVPTGYAVFPNELACAASFVLKETYKNLTTVNYLKDGGHFAAFEQPALMEADVRAFVAEVEKKFPEKLNPPKPFKAVPRK